MILQDTPTPTSSTLSSLATPHHLSRHLAERMLFVAIVKILWAFDIRAKKGQPINTDPHTGYTDGFLRCAKPFAVNITPRSEARRSTIEREFAQADEVFSRYEV